jgi:glycine/D-amino acid oxidase-like deaminating enzyme/nitrite reductase/ring-hydroxylating ferredoxin subunit
MPNYTNSVWSEAAPAKPFPRLDGNLSVDVAIVGGGITGITAARLLKRAGRTVALVESRRIGKGETSKTTSHLTEALDVRYHTLISRFGRERAQLAARGQHMAIAQIAAFVDELGIACDFARVPGYLYSEDAAGVEQLEAEAEAVAKLGIRAGLVTEVPLPFPVKKALRFENQAQLHPREYLLGLAAGVPGDGSHVFEQTHVVDVDENGGEPARVVTENGVITARHVIVAAHVPISNKFFVHTKIAAYRSYVLGVARNGADAPGLFWDTNEPYHYIRTQVVGGVPFLIVGGEDHKVGEEDDTTAPFARLEAYFASHFGQPVAPTDYRWSGQIIVPVDGLPYIGRNALQSHVFVATGFAGNGITQGTLAGLILADEVAGVKNQWAELFDATRFPPLGAAKAYISENVDFPKHLVADRFGLGGAEELNAIAAGEGKVLTVRGQKLAVYRSGGGELSALSPVCTHLGCLVHWNTTEKSWDCPCHGSRFDPTGRVLNGPASEALEARPIPRDEEEEGEAVPALGDGVPA